MTLLDYAYKSIDLFPKFRVSQSRLIDIYRPLLRSITLLLEEKSSASKKAFMNAYQKITSDDFFKTPSDVKYLSQISEMVLFLESIHQTGDIDFIKLKNFANSYDADKNIKNLKILNENEILSNLKFEFLRITSEISSLENEVTHLGTS